MKAAPSYLQFYPTVRCNRSCAFCFNRDLPDLPDMPLADFRKMADLLRSVGVETLDIIGGEPALHPDIVTMVAVAEHYGLNVNLSSNGDDPHTLTRIMERSRCTTVGLSINDRETLRRLRPFISTHRPVVKTVYDPSLDPGLVEEILALTPARFYLLYRDTLGRGEPCAGMPFDRFLATVTARFGPSVGMVYCSGFVPDPAYPELATVRCPAGTTKLGVLPDGSVYPCNLFFGRPEFRLGNILTDAFRTMWNDSRLAFFRAASANACIRTSCAVHGSCRGGCPAHGLRLSGSLTAPDPRCVPSAPRAAQTGQI